MPRLTIAFVGDIYGSPGRMVLQQQLPSLRAEFQPDLIIANAENARSGSGLSPQIYHKIRAYGVDAVTLGDHVFRDQRITSILETPGEPIARPANLPAKAIGRPYIRLEIDRSLAPAPRSAHEGREPAAGGRQPIAVYVMTVLGRVFFNMPADDPFATVDRILAELPHAALRSPQDRGAQSPQAVSGGGGGSNSPIVIVEAHMEATSEKAALAHYLDGRVAAVIGTHTHVPTADARILRGGTAFITDVGMTGPYNSIIGANVEAVVKHMTTGMHAPFGVGSGEEAMCGVVLTIDESRTGNGRAADIRRFEYKADHTKPPFAGPK